MKSRKPDGRVLPGTIVKVENYGLYVKTSAGQALVLIPDVCEGPIDLQKEYSPGDSVRVKLLFFVEQYDSYRATMLDVE